MPPSAHNRRTCRNHAVSGAADSSGGFIWQYEAVKRFLTSLALLAWACSAAAQSGDPFVWLENIDGKDQLDWVRKQNARSLTELEADPRYEPMHQEALAILTSKQRIPLGDIHGDYLYNFWQDEEHVRGLWRRATVASYRTGKPEWETLLDVDAFAALEGKNWVWHGADCLGPAYERCMIELSPGGSDASIEREFSLAGKSFVESGFVVPTGKNSAAWIDEDTLLVSSDWGEGRTKSGYPRTVRKWTRGQDFNDAKVVYTGDIDDVSTRAYVLRHGDEAYPIVEQSLTFYESKYFWLRTNGELTELPLPKGVRIAGATGGRILAELLESWKHRGETYPQGTLIVLRLDDMSAESVFTPKRNQALDGVAAGKTAVFITLLDDVVGKAMRLTRGDNGWTAHEISVPPNGVVSIAAADGERDDFFLLTESLTTPQTLHHVAADDRVTTVQSLPELYDASDVVVEQHFAKSKDGTRVPYFVMGRKEVLEKGDAPTIQYGYGGFLIPILPVYYEDPSRPQHGALAGKLWVSRGGVIVLANIRGGGEYGPRWHDAALKQNRQRAYDDFFAVSEDLIARGVTDPKKLGAVGRSNGGLLMGVALTQRPDLYAAIDCGAPLLDMKRYSHLLAGASWMAEYGDPDIPDQWAYISKYSPYQNLKPGKSYPKVLFYTSTKDDRVHPGHARKMAAKMAEYGYPFYYYENIEGGHGGTSNQDQLAMRTALEFTYFASQLMPVKK